MKQTVAFLIGLLLLAPGLYGAEQDGELLDGLRSRRLFHLAELYCQEHLKDSRIGAPRRARLVTELMRTYAQQALHAPADKRAAAWQQARDAAAAFIRENPQHPRTSLVQMQDALTVLAQAEFDRQQAELTGASDRLEAARQAVREAARLLQSLAKEVGETIPRRHRQEAAGDELTAQELISLQNNIRFQLARAYRNQALTYPEGSQDRIAALLQAAQVLEQAVTQTDAADALASEIRLDQATTWRMLGELQRAEQALEELLAGDVPVPMQLRGRAERLRIAIAAGDLLRVQQALDQGRVLENRSLPELDLARLEAVLAMTQQAGRNQDVAQAQQWQKQAMTLVQLLEQEHGPYWGYRGEILLLRALPEGLGDSNLQVLARAADHHYLRGQWDESIATYEAAAALAREQNEPDLAFELTYKAALVEQQQGIQPRFIERLRTLALDADNHAQAPAVHLQAIGAAADQVRSQADQLTLYRSLLEEHIATWPEAATADQARLWLARLLQFQQEWEAAAQVVQRVSPESPLFAQAVRTAYACWQALCNRAQAKEASVGGTLNQALAFFDGVIFGTERSWPQQWTQAQREAALAAARLRLQFSRGAEHNAETLLRAALADTTNGSPDWLMAARAALVVSLAKQPGRSTEARDVLEDLENAPVATWLDLVHELGEAGGASASPEAVALQIELIDSLASRHDRLDTAQQQSLQRAKAAALAAAGQREEAVALYKQLMAQKPDALHLHEAYARLLTDSTRPEELESALQIWRQIAQRSLARTEAWYDAKYHVALVQLKLGKKAAAAQLLRYLEATGDLSAAPDAQRFRELLRQTES